LYQFLLFINLSWKFCYLLFGCFEWRCFFRKFDLKMVELHQKNNRYNTYRSYPAGSSLRKQITWFSIPKHFQYTKHMPTNIVHGFLGSYTKYSQIYVSWLILLIISFFKILWTASDASLQ
jgi:hypothetical protein